MRISDWSSDVCSSDLNLERVANTLDTSKCSLAAGASIPCADYLGFGDLTPQALDYILFTSRDRGGNELATVTADLNGDLFKLPAGPVSFAAGVDYRKEKGWRDPAPLTVLGIAHTNQQIGRASCRERVCQYG